MNFGNGWGTYLSAGLLLGATLAKQFGWIDEAVYQTLIGLAGAGGLTFLRRAATSNMEKTAAGQAVIAKASGVSQKVIDEKIIEPAAPTEPPPLAVVKSVK